MMGKVLVVDEVHACDDYMLKVLGVLLEFHSRGGGSAVLLSATLPLHAKQRLLTAFARGLAQPAPHMSSAAYPLATTWPAPSCPDRTEEVAIATRDDVRRTVEVSLHEQLADVLMIIRAALSEGRCICWVRNTVADAIEAHSLLQGEVPAGQVWLFHARFVLHDRLTMEDQVLQAFGKRSGRAERTGRLLIATQVVEQSLDVDFDVLVSDLAPIDRLVQRAGRLQRHRRRFDGTPESDPAAGDARGVPLLHLLCPPWTDTPAANWYRKAFPRAAAVYPNHAQLWLTMKLLRNGVFTMPDDARRLIESVFGEDAESPSGLQANAEASAGQRMAAQSQAMMNTLRLQDGYSRNQSGGVDWWSDASTPSRLGEATSNVTLARWDGERLRPWVDRPHGWIYSSLRMATCAIADTAPADNAMLQAAIDDVQKELPAHGRWTVLLPLRETAHGWTGAAMAGGSPASRRAWRYDPQRGLESWRTEDGQTDNRMEASDT
jgi:CRISPR-associated endonuclease/helicase Cas3